MLRVLHDLFYQPMAEGGFFPLEELQNIFPSLDELIEVHCECRAPAPLYPIAASFLPYLPRPGAQHNLPGSLPQPLTSTGDLLSPALGAYT
jgi:hypothetical protein